MKNYLVFVWSVYYPSGGMSDLRQDYDTELEALNAVKDILSNENWDGEFQRVCAYSLKDKKYIR